jgi:hypothetical protein
MTIKDIVKEIASKEGKLKEVSVGNIREIVGIMSDMIFEDWGPNGVYINLYKNGRQRAKKKKKR